MLYFWTLKHRDPDTNEALIIYRSPAFASMSEMQISLQNDLDARPFAALTEGLKLFVEISGRFCVDSM